MSGMRTRTTGSAAAGHVEMVADLYRRVEQLEADLYRRVEQLEADVRELRASRARDGGADVALRQLLPDATLSIPFAASELVRHADALPALKAALAAAMLDNAAQV